MNQCWPASSLHGQGYFHSQTQVANHLAEISQTCQHPSGPGQVVKSLAARHIQYRNMYPYLVVDWNALIAQVAGHPPTAAEQNSSSLGAKDCCPGAVHGDGSRTGCRSAMAALIVVDLRYCIEIAAHPSSLSDLDCGVHSADRGYRTSWSDQVAAGLGTHSVLDRRWGPLTEYCLRASTVIVVQLAVLAPALDQPSCAGSNHDLSHRAEPRDGRLG
jgi:hypothetical protein